MDAPKLSYLTYLGHVFTARVTPQDGWSAAHPRSATPRLHPCDLCFIPRVLCSLAIVLTAFVPCPVFVAGMSPPRAPLQTSPCVRNSVLLSLARRSSSAPRGYINSTLLSRVIALQGTLPASRQAPGKPPKKAFPEYLPSYALAAVLAHTLGDTARLAGFPCTSASSARRKYRLPFLLSRVIAWRASGLEAWF